MIFVMMLDVTRSSLPDMYVLSGFRVQHHVTISDRPPSFYVLANSCPNLCRSAQQQLPTRNVNVRDIVTYIFGISHRPTYFLEHLLNLQPTNNPRGNKHIHYNPSAAQNLTVFLTLIPHSHSNIQHVMIFQSWQHRAGAALPT